MTSSKICGAVPLPRTPLLNVPFLDTISIHHPTSPGIRIRPSTMLTSRGRLSVHAGGTANKPANMKHGLAVSPGCIFGRLMRAGPIWWASPAWLKRQPGLWKYLPAVPSPCKVTSIGWPRTFDLGASLSTLGGSAEVHASIHWPRHLYHTSWRTTTSLPITVVLPYVRGRR